MQNAKDTFYELLRGRVAALNPERTVVVRGVTRPALVVDENELPAITPLPDCFHLRWSDAAVAAAGPLRFVTLTCEIEYETAGSALNGGMDRGRALSAMDAELATALTQSPSNAQKKDYSGLSSGEAAIGMQTQIWWGPLQLGKTKIKDDRLTRTATLAVMSYQEAGEL